MNERNRPSSKKRGGDRRWRKLRRQPICEMEGCQAYAVDVHYLIAKSEGGLDSFENLQALCKRHQIIISFYGG